jgi:hypothetical protein
MIAIKAIVNEAKTPSWDPGGYADHEERLY